MMKTFMAILAWRHEEDADIEYVEANTIEEAQELWWREYAEENDLEHCANLDELRLACPSNVMFLEKPEVPVFIDLEERLATHEERLLKEETEALEREEREEFERVRLRYVELSRKYA